MALLNSEMYGELASVSSAASKRAPGKFFKVFITGKKRPGQQVGSMQAMYEIKDDCTEADYLIHNSESVKFIPYFIKRFWEKNVAIKVGGEDRNKLVAFGWGDDIPKQDDTCRYAYVIGGLLLNSDTNKAMIHSRDIEDAGIKKGDPVLIHFRCDGIKFTGAMNLINALSDKSKGLVPLSNNAEFERTVVTPRRFIVETKIGSAKSDYGDKDVFEFIPVVQLPDKAVEQVMNSAIGLKSDFEKQFDRTNQIKTDAGKSNDRASDRMQFDGPTAASTPESKPSDNQEDNFDLGI
jgi:hypothetical protein